MNNDKSIITMVDRAMKVIDYIYNSNEPVGVSQISKDLELPKATVFRILNTLENWNSVKKVNDSGKYILGTVHIKYGERAKNDFDLVSISTPHMEKLSYDIGETINLGIIHNNNILIIKSIEGESSILVSKLIPITPLHCSSIGKLFLASLNDKELKDYFNSDNLSKRTINTIITLEDFTKEKEEILKNFIAFDNEEYEYGLTCISSPILDSSNDIIAGISISGPTTRLQYKKIENLQERLKETTEKISKELSYLKK